MASIAYAENLDNPSFETGDLHRWTIGAQADAVTVMGTDTVATSAYGGEYTTISPDVGNYMARIGTPGETQPVGPTILYQRFVVTDPMLRFAYDLCTYDYVGYDAFYYTVVDETTGATVDSQNLGSMWGSGNDLKTTGWSYIELDVSGLMGHTLRLEVCVQGTGDNLFATWAYLDSLHADWIPPTTTYSLSGRAGSNGWYISDVRVTLSATDNVGGTGISWTKYSLDNGATWTTYSGPFSINTEGANTLKFYSRDKSGNNEVIQSVPVNIDKTGGEPYFDLSGTLGNNGWYISDVVVTIEGIDLQSGIGSVTYSLNGGAWQTYSSPITISAEGATQVQCQVVNGSGHPGTFTYTQSIKIDKTAPRIIGAATTSPNAYGWYSSGVTVHFDSIDVTSGIASTTPDTTLANEGMGLWVAGTATDNAGNTASYTVPGINIDKTAPTISGATTTSPNENNWYNTDVSVAFAGLDALSGVVSVTPVQTLSSDGESQYVIGTVVDKAGNTANATVSGINIDKTAPTISGAPDRLPNANDWYNADVTVAFTSYDSLSGVESEIPDTTLDNDGAAQSVTGTVIDKAGNSASVTVDGINIDKTAPIISGAPTTPANSWGWYKTDVTVHFTVSDAMSGVKTSTPDTTLTAEAADQSVAGTVVDLAGNSASCVVGGINIDKTAPTISGATTTLPNTAGWYKTDVTVAFTSGDSLSGVDTVTPTTTLAGEGAAQSVTGTVTDKAGNSASVTVGGINIDKTAPVIILTTPVDKAEYMLNTVVIASWSITDAMPGIASSSGTTASGVAINTATPGWNTYTVTATDMAGNLATVSVTYYVKVPYQLVLLEPVTNGKAYNLNQAIPVKFQLKDMNGAFVSTAVANLYVTKVTNGAAGTELLATSKGAANTGNLFRYDATAQQYIFNMDTKPLTAGTWQLRIAMDNCTYKSVTIQLK